MREKKVSRQTTETSISLSLVLEGTGKNEVHTGVGFLDHMLALFARHGRFDLMLSCQGDLAVDDHHTVEDVGIALGQAFEGALGVKRGIMRYGSMLLPMDEALCMVAVDVSGRGTLGFDAALPAQRVGTFDTELVKEFFLAFAREAKVTLHIRGFAGENTHHIVEAMFKAVGHAMRQAVRMDPDFPDEIPSTKGTLGGGV